MTHKKKRAYQKRNYGRLKEKQTLYTSNSHGNADTWKMCF